MTQRILTRRVANRLAQWSGDDGRSQELVAYFDDSVASGYPIAPADIGSLVVAVGRYQGLRALRDLPLWVVGLPVALMVVLPWAIGYESHFFAWDMMEEQPITDSAALWRSLVDALVLAIFIESLVIGRRWVSYITRRDLRRLALSFSVLALGSLQLGRFVDRAPWERDGRLKAEHINEVPYYSIGLYASYVVLLLGLILADLSMDRRLESSMGRGLSGSAGS